MSDELQNQSPESEPTAPETQKQVILLRGAARRIEGAEITLRQAGAASATAGSMMIRQGLAGKAASKELHATQSGILLAQTQSAEFVASTTGVVIAKGEVKLDQSAARLLLTSGDVSIDQGGAAVMAARNIKTQHSETLLLIAGKIEGDVNAVFGPRESAIFGVMAGAAGALVLLLARFLRKRRRS